MLEQNPRYDYTPREYVSLGKSVSRIFSLRLRLTNALPLFAVMSDVGILTPESVSSYCGIFTE